MGIPHPKANEDLVRTDRAHAALVIDADDLAQGWYQYGSPEELRASNTGPSMRRTPRRIQTGGSPASSSIKSPVMPGLPAGTRIGFHRTYQQPGSRTSGT